MMSWWNKYKKPLGLLLVAVICILPIILAFLLLLGPIIGNKFCTLAACLEDGFTVYIQRGSELLDASEAYEIIIDYPFPHESVSINCDENTNIYSMPHTTDTLGEYNYCFVGGALFRGKPDFPPDKITISVIIDGHKVTRKFHPSYDINEINGEGCPGCYWADIYFIYEE